jgi:hypothetical protein
MVKEIKINVPNNWSAVTLKDYLELQADLETYKDDETAFIAVLFYRLCKINPDMITDMDVQSFLQIKEHLLEFINKQDYPLQSIIKIGNVEYGFEPNLAEMEYGAYLDITKFGDLTINKDWEKVMSILYRPIENKSGKVYSIKKYDGKLDGEKFRDVTMDIHFGVQHFFFNISTQLLNATLNSLEKVEMNKEVVQDTEQDLPKSGTPTQQ